MGKRGPAPKPDQMVPVVVHMPPRLYDEVYRHTQATGSKLSTFGREAIIEKLRREMAEAPSIAPVEMEPTSLLDHVPGYSTADRRGR